jgi:hypothetical protein
MDPSPLLHARRPLPVRVRAGEESGEERERSRRGWCGRRQRLLQARHSRRRHSEGLKRAFCRTRCLLCGVEGSVRVCAHSESNSSLPSSPPPQSPCYLVFKAWAHPESDKLWCESIDLGEASGPRTICSGLRAFYATADDVAGRTVPLLGASLLTDLAQVLCSVFPAAP